MSNGNSPNPLTGNQDDLESWRAVFHKLLRSDLATDSNVLQKFLAGLVAGFTSLDVLGGNAAANANWATATAGAAAGGGATATILTGRISGVRYAATNMTGTLRITTGTTPLANGTLATITFGLGINGLAVFMAAPAPRIVGFEPADKVTRQIMTPTQAPIPAQTDGTGWALLSNDIPLAASTTYTWHYLITG